MVGERTTTSRTSDEAVGAALLRYRVMAYVVGVLLIALIVVAVPLKYVADIPEPASVLGTAHGWLYFLFFLATVDLALRAKWSAKGTVLTLVAGTVPFLSFYAERTVTRTMRAGDRI